MLKICLKHALQMPKTCPADAQKIPKRCPKDANGHVTDKIKIWLFDFVHNTLKTVHLCCWSIHLSKLTRLAERSFNFHLIQTLSHGKLNSAFYLCFWSIHLSKLTRLAERSHRLEANSGSVCSLQNQVTLNWLCFVCEERICYGLRRCCQFAQSPK